MQVPSDIAAAAQKIEDARANLARRDAWKAANFPERHRLRRVDRERWPAWETACKKAIGVVEAGGLLALIGVPGTGKTQMAVDCGKYVCMIPKSCMYVKAQEFFKAVRESWGPGRALTELQVIARFCRPHFLVFDDLHVRGDTDDENRLLHLVIDKRYDAMKATALIANQTPEEFRAGIGDPLFTRLLETGGYIKCDWTCIRSELGET